MYGRGKLTFSPECCSCVVFVLISELVGRFFAQKAFVNLAPSLNLDVCKLKSASLSSNPYYPYYCLNADGSLE